MNFKIIIIFALTAITLFSCQDNAEANKLRSQINALQTEKNELLRKEIAEKNKIIEQQRETINTLKDKKKSSPKLILGTLSEKDYENYGIGLGEYRLTNDKVVFGLVDKGEYQAVARINNQIIKFKSINELNFSNSDGYKAKITVQKREETDAGTDYIKGTLKISSPKGENVSVKIEGGYNC